MKIDADRFHKLLSTFKLNQLFNELGWDHAGLGPQTLQVDGQTFTLTPIAQKRGVVVLLCSPDHQGQIPLRSLLLRIEREAVKIAHEHLLICTDVAQSMQTWLWVNRAPGQPAVTRTHTWREGGSGEALRQKLENIVWSLEDEEAITLTDVITGLRRAFDRDRVTRRFFERFQAEHRAFSDFIRGLDQMADRAWYASLMLNRLMFVYFIQYKGFLDGNPRYLGERLRQVQERTGDGHFHSFYRLFLRRLFHEGLGQPAGDRQADLVSLLGRVPYLNGGLFALHELEERYPDIDIPDEAFARLFAFFDSYDWHLDDRPLSRGNEINPDVLGYIFEKYINQKQMGAYYTKEDITDYISRNTIIPFILQRARSQCREAFAGPAAVWNLLSQDPDRYLYPAMKVGVIDADGQTVPESALPDFVQIGMHDPQARMFDRRYNLGEAQFRTATGEAGTLPTETWREYVERRQRCLEVHDRLTRGQVQDIDDLITLNLNIRQFMQDVIDNCDSPVLLRAIWHGIVGRVPERSTEHFRHGIAILDPTCGSGAFLFAALNVLEPLYEACLDRMEGFVEDARILGKAADKGFVRVLEEVGRHPSRRYYIYKSIILNNLFGVDIMAEAVEICKLRLFLKLVSQVDSDRELEPLPDMDFNIRCGNTLVGYATEAQFDAIGRGKLEYGEQQDRKAEIKATIADLTDLFGRFREQQTIHGGSVTAEDKNHLRAKLNGLSLDLDQYLAIDYGINPKNAGAFEVWRKNYQPFHWFAEFYGIMREGGFDVIIGNPPWKEYTAVRSWYRVNGYRTESCGNLYGMCTERSLSLCHELSHFSFIVQLPIVCSSRMSVVRETLRMSSAMLWVITFDDRPGKLFDGLEHCRSTIFIVKRGQLNCCSYTSGYQRWLSVSRNVLFEYLSFVIEADSTQPGRIIAKHADEHSLSVFRKMREATTRSLESFRVRRESSSFVFYQEATGYWTKVTSILPYYAKNGIRSAPSHGRFIFFEYAHQANAATAILNSSLFYVYFIAYSDCFHLSDTIAVSFPVTSGLMEDELLGNLNEQLMIDLNKYCERKTITSRRGGSLDRIEYDEYYGARCKETIDQIDIRLAKIYGFTMDEIDFIVNYDIKFRIGGANEVE